MKPIILITSCYVSKEEINIKQAKSVYSWDYTKAVELAGCVPLILPNICVLGGWAAGGF
ncbi:MAG TPA: hypothetical protein VEG39_10395 [Clostridia bacterium]|nr:hypothetical protein [Clostridia bacterium]